MNISPDNISGDCKLKCAYSFNYPVSNCVTRNNSYSVTLPYDNSSIPAVKFNNAQYNVAQILIVTPSMHKFNGSPADGEIIILHTPTAGGNNFIVCIPIIARTTTTNIVQTIITETIKQAPAKGGTAKVALNNFTLNSIVPKTAFYSYIDASNRSFVVYGIDNAVHIDSAAMKGLKSILTQTPASVGMTFLSGPLLYINSAGPTNGTGGSDSEIYISCQPTGNSEETEEVSYTKPSITNDLSVNGILNNPVVVFILASLFTILVLYALYTLINYVSNGSAAKVVSQTSNKK
jgi:hypothetical protein